MLGVEFLGWSTWRGVPGVECLELNAWGGIPGWSTWGGTNYSTQTTQPPQAWNAVITLVNIPFGNPLTPRTSASLAAFPNHSLKYIYIRVTSILYDALQFVRFLSDF